MKLFLQAGLFFFILFISIYLLLFFYILKNGQKDEKIPADVILVLGAKAYGKNSYNPCLVARVNHAIRLYKAHYASKLLFSGGFDKEDGANEAQIMKQIALTRGVPAKNILLESTSSTTYENLLFAKEILKNNKLNSIILVSDPFHLPRAALVAKKLELKIFSSPAMSSVCWTKNKYLSRHFLKEPLAIMVYKIQNKL